MIKIVELTKDNEEKYLDQIVELEQISLEAMKKEGREGQLFDTGREGISEYVHSNENSVIVATDENDKVEAATYVTQGQSPFTYNDITKYFKYGEKYKQYVKSLYGYLQQELEQNEYHEKSELRENLNRYMSEYIIQNYGKEIAKKYEMFYWITLEDIEAEFGKRNGEESSEIQDYETFMEEEKEYAELTHKGKLKIHEEPKFDETQYYTANTGNAVELDTYLTNPHNRSVGLARIILYNGIQKHIEQFFKNSQNKEIFLCSTLHRDNLSSKYVSEFFGLKDSLYVNRRQGRDREVHICRIPREKAMEYLTDMYDKIAVLYGYNPNNKNIPASRQLQILQEQLEYEEKEKKRLIKAKTIDGKLKGINHKFIPEKERKVLRLKQRIQKVENSQQGLQQ